MRISRLTFALAVMTAALIGADPARAQSPWTIVALPDTQKYSEYYPATFTNQTQWIVNNLAAENIKFVTHEGDIVDDDTTAQWNNAVTSMNVLHGQVRYGTCAGNHDMGAGPYTSYVANFGPARYAGMTWYGGASPNNVNSYQLFQGEAGRTFMVLHLEYNLPAAALTWAQGVITANPNSPTILTTHSYIDTGANRTAAAQTAWDTLIKTNDQIFMVLCGHYHGEARRTDVNNAGNDVFQLLADYQDYPNGGNGYLRLLEFDEPANQIHVKSYSTTLGSYLTDADSQFDLDVNFSQRLIPEPAMLTTIAVGALGVLVRRRRRR